MRKILVKIEDYIKYLEINSNNKLDKSNKIYANCGFPKFLNINEKVFEGRETEYDIIEDTNDKVLIKFKSASETEYRLDLFREPNTQIFHIGFSIFNTELNNEYHTKTNRFEAIDVISRLVWILKDINKNVEYCIGATGDESKDSVYEYIMRFVSNWEKRTTDQYDLGWAIYFSI
jgi:hypothetical protein